MLADAGESYFRLIEIVRADPELKTEFEQRFLSGMMWGGFLLPQSDALKLEVKNAPSMPGRRSWRRSFLGGEKI